jgi:arabinose-5-phosphate isomerase
MMCRHAQGAVNVLDESQLLVGIITDGDIRRTVERVPAERLGSLTAHNLMTPNPVTVLEDCLAVDALSTMEDRESQISVVPVLQSSSRACVGLLRLHDILRCGVT